MANRLCCCWQTGNRLRSAVSSTSVKYSSQLCSLRRNSSLSSDHRIIYGQFQSSLQAENLSVDRNSITNLASHSLSSCHRRHVQNSRRCFSSSSSDGSSNGDDKNKDVTPSQEMSISDIAKKGPVKEKDIEGKVESFAGAYRDPFKLLQNEMKSVGRKKTEDDGLKVPRETDIVIIGGGAFGLATAFWLKQQNPEGFNLTVIEKDPSYTRAATTLSVGGIRHQFSLPENIQMSMFGSEFFRDIREYLSVLDLDPPDVQFNHQGYLLLASEKGAEKLVQNHKTQVELGAKIDLLTAEKIKVKFPWLNVEDVAMGTYGVANEGWFDPWLFLTALKVKCLSLGVKYVKGEVVGFTSDDTLSTVELAGKNVPRSTLTNVLVKADDGKTYPMTFAACVNCAGPWAGEVARLAGIGVEDSGPTSVPLPIEPRKRFVYLVHCPGGPTLDTPLLCDSSGIYMRREGLAGHYICGASPPEGEEPDASSLDIDYEFFHKYVWPRLAHRAPTFECLKYSGVADDALQVDPGYYDDVVLPKLVHRIPVFAKAKLKSAWAGYYDYNYFDENLIIGNHPYHRNFLIAAGASGHGIQHSPAVGRAVMELILDNEFTTIDLSRLSFDRILNNEPVFEDNII